jgi:hypothetical protein
VGNIFSSSFLAKAVKSFTGILDKTACADLLNCKMLSFVMANMY